MYWGYGGDIPVSQELLRNSKTSWFDCNYCFFFNYDEIMRLSCDIFLTSHYAFVVQSGHTGRLVSHHGMLKDLLIRVAIGGGN
jgi:hypothetical protein